MSDFKSDTSAGGRCPYASCSSQVSDFKSDTVDLPHEH